MRKNGRIIYPSILFSENLGDSNGKVLVKLFQKLVGLGKAQKEKAQQA